MDYAPGIKEVAILDENILSGNNQKYKIPVIIGCGNDGIIKDIYCDNPSVSGIISFTGNPYLNINGIIKIKKSGDIGVMGYAVSNNGGESYNEIALSTTGQIDIGV